MKTSSIRPLPAVAAAPVVYQIFLRSFTPEGTLRAASGMLGHIASLGVDVVYLCPVVEADRDAREEFWSPRQRRSGLRNPKNPYRLGDYFRIDPEYGTADDLKAFVREAHRFGLRVLLDLVYLHCGPDASLVTEHPDWVRRNEDGTPKFNDYHFHELNFDSAGLREYLWNNMEHFVSEYDVDGYRCDVAGGVPLDFWEEGRRRIDALKPGVLMMIAESPGSLAEERSAFELCYGFEFNLALEKLVKQECPVADFRRIERDLRISTGGARLLRMFDNHDIANDAEDRRAETVAAPGATDAALALIFWIDGVPMLYNGQEVADGNRHSLWADREHGHNNVIDWQNALTPAGRKRMEFLRELIRLRRLVPALAEGRFSELTLPDEVLYAFSRTGGGRTLTAIFNFTPNVRRAESGIAVRSVLNGQKFEVISPETGLLELKPYGFILFE